MQQTRSADEEKLAAGMPIAFVLAKPKQNVHRPARPSASITMTIKINQNIISLLLQRNLNRATQKLETSFDRLSSGERIRKSSDDPAGLSTSQQIRYEIRGLQRSEQNVSGALSMLGTAETALDGIQTSLQRARELVVQAGNDTLNPADRQLIRNELDQLLAEIQRTADDTGYLGQNLLDGSIRSQKIQVGSVAGQVLELTIGDSRPNVLGQIARITGSSAVSAQPIPGLLPLLVNGIAVPATTPDGVSFTGGSASAIAKANAINSIQTQTGVTAIVEAAEYVSPGAQIGTVALDGSARSLTINGVNIGAVAVFPNDPNNGLVEAINAASGQTGVQASITQSGELRLVAEDGRNITITTTGSVADELGLASANLDLTGTTVSGKLTLQADAPFTLNNAGAILGISDGQVGLDPTTALTGLDISTGAAATLSIASLDAAGRQLSATRSNIGALQNRLEGITQSLSVRITELSSSDSRIRDADFAVETARLTQAQILQEAGISLLTQANASPRTALQILLRG